MAGGKGIEIGVKVVVEEMDQLGGILDEVMKVAKAIQSVSQATDLDNLGINEKNFSTLLNFLNELKGSLESLKEQAASLSELALDLNIDTTQIQAALTGAIEEAFSKIHDGFGALVNDMGSTLKGYSRIAEEREQAFWRIIQRMDDSESGLDYRINRFESTLGGLGVSFGRLRDEVDSLVKAISGREVYDSYDLGSEGDLGYKPGGGERLDRYVEEIRETVEGFSQDISVVFNGAVEDVREGFTAFSDILKGLSDLTSGIETQRASLADIGSKISQIMPTYQSLDWLNKRVKTLSDSFKGAAEAVGHISNIQDALAAMGQRLQEIMPTYQSLDWFRKRVSKLSEVFSETATAVEAFKSVMEGFSGEDSVDFDTLQSTLSSAYSELDTTIQNVRVSLVDLIDGVNSVSQSFSVAASEVAENLGAISTEEVEETLSFAAADMAGALGKLEEVVSSATTAISAKVKEFYSALSDIQIDDGVSESLTKSIEGYNRRLENFVLTWSLGIEQALDGATDSIKKSSSHLDGVSESMSGVAAAFSAQENDLVSVGESIARIVPTYQALEGFSKRINGMSKSFGETTQSVEALKERLDKIAAGDSFNFEDHLANLLVGYDGLNKVLNVGEVRLRAFFDGVSEAAGGVSEAAERIKRAIDSIAVPSDGDNSEGPFEKLARYIDTFSNRISDSLTTLITLSNASESVVNTLTESARNFEGISTRFSDIENEFRLGLSRVRASNIKTRTIADILVETAKTLRRTNKSLSASADKLNDGRERFSRASTALLHIANRTERAAEIIKVLNPSIRSLTKTFDAIKTKSGGLETALSALISGSLTLSKDTRKAANVMLSIVKKVERSSEKFKKAETAISRVADSFNEIAKSVAQLKEMFEGIGAGEIGAKIDEDTVGEIRKVSVGLRRLLQVVTSGADRDSESGELTQVESVTLRVATANIYVEGTGQLMTASGSGSEAEETGVVTGSGIIPIEVIKELETTIRKMAIDLSGELTRMTEVAHEFRDGMREAVNSLRRAAAYFHKTISEGQPDVEVTVEESSPATADKVSSGRAGLTNAPTIRDDVLDAVIPRLEAEMHQIGVMFRERVPMVMGAHLKNVDKIVQSFGAEGVSRFLRASEASAEKLRDIRESIIRAREMEDAALGLARVGLSEDEAARIQTIEDAIRTKPEDTVIQGLYNEVKQRMSKAESELAEVEAVQAADRQALMDNVLRPLETFARRSSDIKKSTEQQVKLDSTSKELSGQIIDGLRLISAEMTRAYETGDTSELQATRDTVNRYYNEFVRLKKDFRAQEQRLLREYSEVNADIEKHEAALRSDDLSAKDRAAHEMAVAGLRERSEEIDRVVQSNRAMLKTTEDNMNTLQGSLKTFRAYGDAVKSGDAYVQKAVRDFHRLTISTKEASGAFDEISERFDKRQEFISVEDAQRAEEVYKRIQKEIGNVENAIQAAKERQDIMLRDLREHSGLTDGGFTGPRLGEFRGLDDEKAARLYQDRMRAIESETNRNVAELSSMLEDLSSKRKAMHESGIRDSARDRLEIQKFSEDFHKLDKQGAALVVRYKDIASGIRSQTLSFEEGTRVINKAESEYKSLLNTIDGVISSIRASAGGGQITGEMVKVVSQFEKLRQNLIKQRGEIAPKGGSVENFLFTQGQIEKTQKDFLHVQNSLQLFKDRWNRAMSDINAGRNLVTATQDMGKLESEIKSTRQTAENIIVTYDKLERELGGLTKEQALNRDRARELVREYTNLNTALTRTRPTLDNIGKSAVRAGQSFKMYNMELVNSIKSNFRFIHAMGIVGTTLMAVRSGFQEIIQESASIARTMTVARSDFMSFEEQLQKVTGTIRRLSIEFGETSAEVAEVIKQFGSAGLELEAALAGARPALELITATWADAEETTRSMAGVYHIFADQLSKTRNEMEIMSTISDVLAIGYRNHQMELSEVTQGLRFAASTGKVAGFTFQELVAYLAVLNDNMIKSGAAGRTLQRVFAQFTSKPMEFAEAFGFEIDVDAQLADQFLAILEHVNRELRTGATTTAQLEQSFSIFGLRGARAFETLAGNVDAVHHALREMNEEAEGTANKLSEITKDSLARRWEAMKQSLLEFVRDGIGPTTYMIEILTEQIIKFQEVLKQLRINRFILNFSVWSGAILLVVQSFLALQKLFSGAVQAIVIFAVNVWKEIAALRASAKARDRVSDAIGKEIAMRKTLSAVTKENMAVDAASAGVAAATKGGGGAAAAGAARGGLAGVVSLAAGFTPIGKAIGALLLALGGIYLILTNFTDIFRSARDVRKEIDEIRAKTAEWKEESRGLDRVSSQLKDLRDDFHSLSAPGDRLAKRLRDIARTAPISSQLRHQILTASDKDIVRDIDRLYDTAQREIASRQEFLAQQLRAYNLEQARKSAEEFSKTFVEENKKITRQVQSGVITRYIAHALGPSALQPLGGRNGRRWISDLSTDMERLVNEGRSVEEVIERLEETMLVSQDGPGVWRQLDRMDFSELERKIAEGAMSLEDTLRVSGVMDEEEIERHIYEFINENQSSLVTLLSTLEKGTDEYEIVLKLIQGQYDRIRRIMEDVYTVAPGTQAVRPVSIERGVADSFAEIQDIIGTPVPNRFFDETISDFKVVKDEIDSTSRLFTRFAEFAESGVKNLELDLKISDLIDEIGTSEVSLLHDSVEEALTEALLGGGADAQKAFIDWGVREKVFSGRFFDTLLEDLSIQERIEILDDTDISEFYANAENSQKAFRVAIKDTMAALRSQSLVFLENEKALNQVIDRGFDLSKLTEEEAFELVEIMVTLDIGTADLRDRIARVPEEVGELEIEVAFDGLKTEDELGRVRIEVEKLLTLTKQLSEWGGIADGSWTKLLTNIAAFDASKLMTTFENLRSVIGQIDRQWSSFLDTMEISLRGARRENELFNLELEQSRIHQQIITLEIQGSSLDDIRNRLENLKYEILPVSGTVSTEEDSEGTDSDDISKRREERLKEFEALKDAYELLLDKDKVERDIYNYIRAQTLAMREQDQVLRSVQLGLEGIVSLEVDRYEAIRLSTDSLIQELIASEQLVKISREENELSRSKQSAYLRNVKGLIQLKNQYAEVLQMRREYLASLREENKIMFDTLDTIEQTLHPEEEIAGIKYRVLGMMVQVNKLEKRRAELIALANSDLTKQDQYQSEMVKLNRELVELYQGAYSEIDNMIEAEEDLLDRIDRRMDAYESLADLLGEQADEFGNEARNILTKMLSAFGDSSVRELSKVIGSDYVTVIQDSSRAVEIFAEMADNGRYSVLGLSSGLDSAIESARLYRSEQERAIEVLRRLQEQDMRSSFSRFSDAIRVGDIERARDALDRFGEIGEKRFSDNIALLIKLREDMINMEEQLSATEAAGMVEELRLVVNEDDKQALMALFEEIKKRLREIQDEFHDILGLTEEQLTGTLFGSLLMQHQAGQAPDIMRNRSGEKAITKRLDSIDSTLKSIAKEYFSYSGGQDVSANSPLEVSGSEVSVTVNRGSNNSSSQSGLYISQFSNPALNAALGVPLGLIENQLADLGDVAEETARELKKIDTPSVFNVSSSLTSESDDKERRDSLRDFEKYLDELILALGRRDAMIGVGADMRGRSPMLDLAISSIEAGLESIGDILTGAISQVFIPEFAKINAEAYRTYVKALTDIGKRYADSIDAAGVALRRNESSYLSYVNSVVDAEKQRHEELMNAQEQYRESIKSTKEVLEDQLSDLIGTSFSAEGFGAAATGVISGIGGFGSFEDDMNHFLGAFKTLKEHVNPFEDVRILFDSIKNSVKAILPETSKTFDLLSEALGSFVNVLGSAGGMIAGQIVETVMAGVFEVLQLTIGEDADMMVAYLEKFIYELPEVIVEYADQFLENFSLLITALAEGLPEIVDSLVDTLPEVIMNLVEVLRENLPDIIDAIAGLIPELLPVLLEAFVDLLVIIASKLPDIIAEIVKSIPMIIVKIVPALIKLIFELIKSAIKLPFSIFKGITGGIGSAVEKFHSGGYIGVSSAARVAEGLRSDEVPIIAQTGEGVLSRVGMANLGGVGVLNALNDGYKIGNVVDQIRREGGVYHSGGMIGESSRSTIRGSIVSSSGSSGSASVSTTNVTINVNGGSSGRRIDDVRLARTIATEVDRAIGRKIRDGDSKISKEIKRVG